MEALASRIGRLEARVDVISKDVISLQREIHEGKHKDLGGSHDGDGAPRSAALAEWVRLFEREVATLRRQGQLVDRAAADLESRLRDLEGWRLEVLEDTSVQELAEIVLADLCEIRAQLHEAFKGHTRTSLHGHSDQLHEDSSNSSPRNSSPCNSSIENARLAKKSKLLQLLYRASGADDRMEELQSLSDESRTRVKRLEDLIGDAENEAEDSSDTSLCFRLSQLEVRIQDLEPLGRYGVSLRALEETEAKVQELQKLLTQMPVDAAISKSVCAAKELQAATQQATGTISVMDAYRLKADMEQVMSAIEALVRQRNDDLRLMNMYLSEVYVRIERDVPKDSSGTLTIQKLTADVAGISSRLSLLADVEFHEVEARLLHEVQAAKNASATCNSMLEDMNASVKLAVTRSAEAETRCKKLCDNSDKHALMDTRHESVVADIRREMSRQRLEIGELAAAHRGTVGVGLEAKIGVVRAELQAELDHQATDARRQAEQVERELRSLRMLDKERAAAAGSAAGLFKDLEQHNREFVAFRTEVASWDADVRGQLTRVQSELRSEIRALQRLVLEMAERLRSDDIAQQNNLPALRHCTTPASHGGSTIKDEASLVGPAADLHKESQHDFGVVAMVSEDTAEWHVPGVRGCLQRGDNSMLVSRPFLLPRFPEAPQLRLKLYPLGSRRRNLPGYCSVYVSGSEGAHIQFVVRLGAVEHGPLEGFFDRPDKDTGRHDFCQLEDELEEDGSAVVRLTVTRVVTRTQSTNLMEES